MFNEGVLFYFCPLARILIFNVERSVSRKPRSCGRGPRRAGFATSDTIQEINLNYRDAPPCRRGASLILIWFSGPRQLL